MAPAADPKGARTRREILRKAVDIASAEGLEGLTIGRLAAATSMSKTGLFAHFGSREDLQLAVVEEARALFEEQVFGPHEAPGMANLLGLTGRWLAYLERSPLRGGCFFSAASTEMDDRPGRVRDRIAGLIAAWHESIRQEVGIAVDEGQLLPASEPEQIAFELHAFLQEANRAFQLHGDAEVFRRAEAAVHRILDSAVTSRGRAILASARI